MSQPRVLLGQLHILELLHRTRTSGSALTTTKLSWQTDMAAATLWMDHVTPWSTIISEGSRIHEHHVRV